MEIKKSTAVLKEEILEFENEQELMNYIHNPKNDVFGGDFKIRKMPGSEHRRLYMGVVETVDVGDIVHANMGYKNHVKQEIVGTVTGVQFDENFLEGCWISIKVKEFVNKKSKIAGLYQNLVDKGWYNILCPRADVWKEE